MSNEKADNISTTNSAILPSEQDNECPALMKKIGKTTYRVRVHFRDTNAETMSNKIKRMLRNEVSQQYVRELE